MAGHAEPVRIEADSRPEQQLAWRVGSGQNVAGDDVRIALLEVACGLHVAGHDPVAESGRESFDLALDRVGCVAGETGRHVRVGIERMQIAV